jgi:hypothetical protein
MALTAPGMCHGQPASANRTQGVLPGWIFDEVMALPYHLHQTDRSGLGFGRRAKFITADPVEGPKERQAAWLLGRTF